MNRTGSRAQVLERMLDGYEAYFDIKRWENQEKSLPLAAECSFHVHSEKYVLVKKAKLWDADSNEYVYIFSMPQLTKELYESCKDYAYTEGMKRIDPKPGHMYSYITPVFLCDTCTKEAEQALKRCRIYKSFHFSWYGWMNVHTAVLICEDGRVVTNRMGRGNAKFMKNILHVTRGGREK